MTTAQLRMALGYVRQTHREIAADTGVDHAQISRIANGKAGAKHETMERLRRYFTDEHGLRFISERGWVCVCAPDD